MSFIRRNWLVILIAVALLGWFTIVKVDRVPEPEPVTAEWSDGYGTGLVINMKIENIAYDCKLGKRFLKVMKQATISVPEPEYVQTTLPAYVNIPLELPDDRTGILKYYLTYWQGEFRMRFVSCDLKK